MEKKEPGNKKENGEWYLDVRKVDANDNDPEDPGEVKKNETAQEENKRSQKNAEKDAPYGDSSEPAKSKVKRKK
jgi:hypothetical protein